MFKLLLILLCLTSFNSFASIITHSKSDLSDSAYILAMNNQQYGEQYQKIMYLIKNDELGKAKQAFEAGGGTWNKSVHKRLKNK